MSSLFYTYLDILASGRAEIREIEKVLQEPCEELILWFAREFNEKPNAFTIKDWIAFERTCVLGYKARRYKSYCKSLQGLVGMHVCFVSRDFPKAIFLVEHWDTDGDYSNKRVIHAGDVIRFSHDDGDREQWALPNIFDPYQAEYELGLEFGSLWDKWLDGMRKAVEELARDDKRSPARAAADPVPNRNPDDISGMVPVASADPFRQTPRRRDDERLGDDLIRWFRE